MLTRSLAAAVWVLVLAAAGILASEAVWAAAFPLAVLLLAAVVLWTGNELANRIEDLDTERHPHG